MISVHFLVQAAVAEHEEHQISKHLSRLHSYLTSVKIPARDLAVPATGIGVLKNVLLTGPLTCHFEDDHTGSVAAAIEFLTTHPRLRVYVCHGQTADESVADTVYCFMNVKAKTCKHTFQEYVVDFDFGSAQFGSFPNGTHIKEIM
jgi:hypothetical protein